MDPDVPDDESNSDRRDRVDQEDVGTIPNPPEGGIPSDDADGAPRSADSIEELLAYLNGFAKQHGFAIIRRQGSNKRKETGEYTQWPLVCDRDAVRRS
jgi:hypothetical protein